MRASPCDASNKNNSCVDVLWEKKIISKSKGLFFYQRFSNKGLAKSRGVRVIAYWRVESVTATAARYEVLTVEKTTVPGTRMDGPLMSCT
jgi:hypothetical protein